MNKAGTLQQLSLELPLTDNDDPYLEEDFLMLDENRAAFNFLTKFFAQKRFSQAQFPSLILRGESKSGKTHLLHIFAKKVPIEFVRIEDFSHQNLATFFRADQFYVLEDIDFIEDERLLLHFINAANEAKAFLILSSKHKCQFEIKDLMSRVRNIFAFDIKSPSQETVKMLLMNVFARKQMSVPKRIIDVITRHIDRTYEAVFDSVKLVEFYREEEGKNITVKEVKKMLSKS